MPCRGRRRAARDFTLPLGAQRLDLRLEFVEFVKHKQEFVLERGESMASCGGHHLTEKSREESTNDLKATEKGCGESQTDGAELEREMERLVSLLAIVALLSLVSLAHAQCTHNLIALYI